MATIRGAIGVSAALLSMAACGGDTDPVARDALGDETITVGSFAFSESVLLAELYSQALENNGIPVIRALSWNWSHVNSRSATSTRFSPG